MRHERVRCGRRREEMETAKYQEDQAKSLSMICDTTKDPSGCSTGAEAAGVEGLREEVPH